MTNDKDQTPIAQDVITKCTKCKKETSHVVVVHNKDGIIEKVKCHVCGSEHKYRPDKKKAPKKAVKTARKSTRTKKVDFAKDFEKLVEKFKEKAPVPYSMSGSFNEDDVIDHKAFGMGFVVSVSTQKMEVAFSDKPRILVCNREITD